MNENEKGCHIAKVSNKSFEHVKRDNAEIRLITSYNYAEDNSIVKFIDNRGDIWLYVISIDEIGQEINY